MALDSTMKSTLSSKLADFPPSTPRNEDQDDALAGLYAASQQAGEGAEESERSASLWADPKMRELTHFLGSHKHEAKVKQRVGEETMKRTSSKADGDAIKKVQSMKRSNSKTALQETQAKPEQSLAPPDPGQLKILRTDGVERFNKSLKKLAHEKATLPGPKRVRSLPQIGLSTLTSEADLAARAEAEAQRQRDKERKVKELDISARFDWRRTMDDSLQRLLVDMELSGDERLKEYAAHSRCTHLDKIYQWYQIHGMKEARKERPGPPYVCYTKNGPVMPGSMRPAPKSNEKPSPPQTVQQKRAAIIAAEKALMASLNIPEPEDERDGSKEPPPGGDEARAPSAGAPGVEAAT